MLAACLQLGDAACGRTQLNSEDTGAQSPDTPRGTKARYTSTLLDVCLKPNTPARGGTANMSRRERGDQHNLHTSWIAIDRRIFYETGEDSKTNGI